MIKPTSDRKTRKYSGQYNCYGLLPGREGTCPGATTGSGGCCWTKPGRKLPVCYVMQLMSAYKGIRGVLTHNTEVLRNADLQQKQAILEAEFQRFLDAEERRAKRTGETPWLFYRLHWSGDFFDEEYVRAAAAAMRKFPQIHFWTYTRSLFAIPILAEVDNLVTYISLDPDNMVKGLDTYYTWQADDPKSHNIQICYLSPTHENDFEVHWRIAEGQTRLKKIWDKQPPKLSTCPVDVKTMPLEGGCSRCQKCLGTCPKKNMQVPTAKDCASCHQCQTVHPNLRPIWFRP